MTLVAPVIVIVTLAPRRGAGDEPGRLGSGLGRLFRFGAASTAPSSPPPAMAPAAPPSGTPSTPAPAPPLPAPSTPEVLGSSATPAPAPRIVPRPRVSRPLTESDPILTRITLNRSDDGNPFGMFLQVFADGTVLDGDGAHHVGQDALKPIIDALQAGDLYRLRGHCGAPATDYVESVHVIVYERSLGRLRANAFSYSGNPQGCDNAVRHLHALLDNLQSRISRPITSGATAGAGAVATPAAPVAAPPSPGASPTVIPLTPEN